MELKEQSRLRIPSHFLFCLRKLGNLSFSLVRFSSLSLLAFFFFFFFF